MNEKLKNHITMLFENAPKTRKAYEMKEELLANSQEKYQDLLSAGMSEEDAYKNVISSIGDVSILFSGLEEYTNNGYESETAIKKRAMIKTIAIGLYIFSGVVFIALGMLSDIMPGRVDWSEIGLVIMIMIDIIPTCMLVYIAGLKPKYLKADDTIAEEFKQWQSTNDNNKEVKRAISSIIWTLTLVLYFTISFLTGAWYITWVLFILGACVQSIVGLLFSLKK